MELRPRKQTIVKVDHDNASDTQEDTQKKRRPRTTRAKAKSVPPVRATSTTKAEAEAVAQQQQLFRKVRGKRGSLQAMIDMPLDINLEVSNPFLFDEVERLS